MEARGTAAELGRTALAMLVHPTLGDDDMAHAAETIASIVRAATR